MKIYKVLFLVLFMAIAVIIYSPIHAIENENIDQTEYVGVEDNYKEFKTCGSIGWKPPLITDIPPSIPKVVRVLYLIIQIAVPIVLVVLGSLDLFKGIYAQKDEEIKKGQQTFVKRLITAAIIFLVFMIVKLFIGFAADSNSNQIVKCIECFIENKCDKASASNNGTNNNSNNSSNSGSNNSSNNSTSSTTMKKATTNKEIRQATLSSSTIKAIYTEVSNLRNSLLQAANSTSKNKKTTTTTSTKTTNIKSNTMYVGDSRTVGMCEYSKLCGNSKYIAESSMGYDWFAGTAMNKINSEIKSKEYNIVILMGVNGVGTTESSGSSEAKLYYNKVIALAKKEWKNQYIVFVSVNPVNGTNAKKYGMSAEQVAVNSFNKAMKNAISSANLSNLKYCDTASKLKMSEIDGSDGIHYNDKGYQQIYSIINSDCLK